MKEPKDFHLARRAYEAFNDEQPQVWFENLNHDYQMKWVRAARAVVEDNKVYRKHAPKVPHRGLEQEPTEPDELQERIEEARTIIEAAPKITRGGRVSKLGHLRINWTDMTPEERRRTKRAYKLLWKHDIK